jgi:putative CocE/NonD family hydrolase
MSRESPPTDARMHWGIKIPLRDGIRLSATLYLPKNHQSPSPAIFTLTPYIGQTYHDVGMSFAARGYPFLTVDVRGRGNSEGVFRPFINEAQDGFDVVEWLAKQPYCDGQVTMWGGSYAGFDQWATAKELPPHLATIVPVASPYLGVDFPIRNNIAAPYLIQWLTLVSGRTSQDKIFWNNESFWGAKFREWFESGKPFKEFDSQFGNPSPVFQEWVSHPQQESHWENYNPTSEQYAKLSIPILTITGIYDDDQLGALTHYRKHLESASDSTRVRHYLVIGPWDHAGTRVPKTHFGGLHVGPASLIDLIQLHVQWYAWTMRAGREPEFLKKRVAYYVMGAEKWRYADTLEAVTGRSDPLYLQSVVNPTDVFNSGSLTYELPVQTEPDHYIYDPRDVGHAALESTVDPENRVDQRMIHAAAGRQLIYHSRPFDTDVEISGFFSLSVWLAIDQADTDFCASIYEIGLDGSSVVLTTDLMRARYRENFREPKLISTHEPQCYKFRRFPFVSRLVKKGNRLRLAIGPINSIYSQKNYNSGGIVAEESIEVARPVTVKLFHDRSRPSALYVPLGSPEN